MFDETQKQEFFEFQKTAIEFVSHPRLRDAVEELEFDRNIFAENEQNPVPFFRARGFDLPEDATIKISHNSPVTVCLSVNDHMVCVSVLISVM
jgi:hypothetical protein